MPKNKDGHIDLTGRSSTWTDADYDERLGIKKETFVSKYKKTIIGFIAGFLALVVAPILVLTYQKHLEDTSRETNKVQQTKQQQNTQQKKIEKSN